MAVGKVISFPGYENWEEEYEQFKSASNARLKVLIETLTLSFNKGMLTEPGLYGVLEYVGINPYEDFTENDLAILNFHLQEYYKLKVQF